MEFVFLFAVPAFVLLCSISTGRLAYISNASICIQDFAYHYLVIDKAWEQRQSPYSIDLQSSVLSNYLETENSNAMPLGITPIVVLFGGAYSWLFGDNISTAYYLWQCVSILLFCYVVATLVKDRKIFNLENKTIFLLMISPIVTAAVHLGQSSLLGVSVVLLLLKSMKNPINTFVLMCIAAIKPPYLLFAMWSLILRQQYRDLLTSLIGLVILYGLLHLLFPLNWTIEYYNSLAIYTKNTIPAYYANSIQYSTMSTLNAVLHSFGVHDFRYLVVLSPMFLIFSLFLVRKGECSLILLVSSYLLFSPYVGGYENVFVLVPLLLTRLSTTVKCVTNILALIYFYSSLLGIQEPVWNFLLLLILLVTLSFNSLTTKSLFTESKQSSQEHISNCEL
jgi:hypothetical protein